jgi:hypothetical protein
MSETSRTRLCSQVNQLVLVIALLNIAICFEFRASDFGIDPGLPGGWFMRIFEILNIQHLALYLLPSLAFIVIFAAGLGYYYVRRRDSEERESRIIENYPGGIEGRNAPFPLVLTLLIAGTVAWCLLYIILIGLLKIKI